jgi:sugar-specific transcriptional regulator TrmB
MPHEIHYPILSQLGINQSEAITYELLLELGPKTAQELVAPSGLGRGNLYNVLTSLKQKGLVIEESGRKTVFRATDPEQLRALAEAKLKSVEELMRQLSATLPTLKSHFRQITKKPTIRILEGLDGLKVAYREMLEQKEPIYSLIGIEHPHPSLLKWLDRVWVKKRISAGITSYVVYSGDERPKMHKKISPELMRESIILNYEAYPFKGEVAVFRDKTALISFGSGELIAVLIENEALSTTLRSTVRAIFACVGTKTQS